MIYEIVHNQKVLKIVVALSSRYCTPLMKFYSRFGLINAVKTKAPVEKDEEFFASYGYQITNGPKWYRNLYRQFEGAKPEIIEKLDAFEAEFKQPFEELTIGNKENEI